MTDRFECLASDCLYMQLDTRLDDDGALAGRGRYAPDLMQAKCGASADVVREHFDIEVPCGYAAGLLIEEQTANDNVISKHIEAEMVRRMGGGF